LRDVKERESLTESSAIGRVAGLTALAAAAVAAVVLLMGSGGGNYTVTAEFESASQVVGGEQVVVGGVPAGSVEEVALGPEGQAQITFSVDDHFAPLRRGTTATIRSFSLSGVANRQIQLTLPPNGEEGEEIEDGGTLSQAETVAEVDIDQLFNTLDEETVEDFKHVIQGFERSYEGIAPEANRGFHFLNPFLSTSRRVFNEINRDTRTLENLLVHTARFSGALAEVSPAITEMVGNLNAMMNAIGDRRDSLAEAVSKLPDFMRRSNTTFVNLRAALDDVDPLIDASKPVAKRLQTFLPLLREAADDAVPTVRDLDRTVKRPGRGNDLIELTRLQVPLARAAMGTGFFPCGPGPENPEDLEIAARGKPGAGAFAEARCSLANGIANLAFFRAYTPELVGWFDDFGHSGGLDAAGSFGRISTVFNTFTVSPQGLPDIDLTTLGQQFPTLGVRTLSDQIGLIRTGLNRRCPGGLERPLGAVDPDDDSIPFTADLGPVGDCDPEQVAPGP
jgi:phospholipid/cholesterol/gamma-HCH transport system substrate-binding protein